MSEPTLFLILDESASIWDLWTDNTSEGNSYLADFLCIMFHKYGDTTFKNYCSYYKMYKIKEGDYEILYKIKYGRYKKYHRG